MSSGFDGYGLASEIYSDIFGEPPEEEKSSPFSSFLSSRSNRRPLKNIGQPSETYLTITKYNDILNSYQYSLTSALESKASASKTYRSQTLGSALQKVLPSSITINDVRRNRLLELEKDFLKVGSNLLKELQELQRDLIVVVMKQKMKDLKVNLGELDPPKSEYKDAILFSSRLSASNIGILSDKKLVTLLSAEVAFTSIASLYSDFGGSSSPRFTFKSFIFCFITTTTKSLCNSCNSFKRLLPTFKKSFSSSNNRFLRTSLIVILDGKTFCNADPNV